MLETTPHPEWVERLFCDIRANQDRVVDHPVFVQLRAGLLPVAAIQKAVIGFFPLIKNFPEYMELNLSKVPAARAWPHDATRTWLVSNIHQEQRHAKWWLDFAHGFGIDASSLSHGVRPPAEMDAINKYLWRVCKQDSLVEGVAAANYAIEGPTGVWTKNVKEGFEFYRDRPGVKINHRTLAWINAHASYDDNHPREALEILKAYATTRLERAKVTGAVQRTLEYYAMALDCVLN